MGQTPSRGVNQIQKDVIEIQRLIREERPNLDDVRKSQYKNALLIQNGRLQSIRPGPAKIAVMNLLQDVLNELNSDTPIARNPTRKSGKTRKEIDTLMEDVEIISKSINTELNNEEINHFQRELVRHSQRLSSIRKKYKSTRIDSAQNRIAAITKELISAQESKTSSPVEERELEILETPKVSLHLSTTSVHVEDIENKMQQIEADISVAANNEDTKQLNFLLKSIKTLIADLDKISIEDSHLLLEKLQKKTEVIEVEKNRIARKVKAVQEKTKKKQEFMSDIEDMEMMLNGLQLPEKNRQSQHIRSSKELLVRCMNKLKIMEDFDDEEATKKKNSLLQKIEDLQKCYQSLEAQAKLEQSEEGFKQFQGDLKKISTKTKSNTFKQSKQYLSQLNEYLNNIPDVDQNVELKKKKILEEVNSSIKFMQETEDQVDKPKLLIEEVKQSWDKFEEKFSISDFNSQELNTQKLVLEGLKLSIDKIILKIHNKISNQKLKADADLVKDLVIAKELPKKESALSKSHENLKSTTLQKQDLGKGQSFDYISNIKDVSLVKSTLTIAELPKKTTITESNTVELRSSTHSSRTDIPQSVLSCATNSFEYVSTSNPDLLKATVSIRDLPIKRSIDSVKVSEIMNQITEGNHKEAIDVSIKRNSTTSELLSAIMNIGTKVEILRKIVEDEVKSEELEQVRRALLKYDNVLLELQPAKHNVNIINSRNDVRKEIQAILNTLNNKVNPQEEISKNLNILKEKVSRFTGTFKNVLYKTLEQDLIKLKSKVPEQITDQNKCEQFQKEITNCFRILEQRSSKDFDLIENTNTVESLAKVETKVMKAKKDIHSLSTLTQILEYDDILTQLTLELDSFKFPSNNVLHSRKLHILSDIQTLANTVEDLILQAQSKEELSRMEIIVEKLKEEVEAFNGTKNSPQLARLDEQINKIISKIHSNTNPDLDWKRKYLLSKIQNCQELLDEKITPRHILTRESSLVNEVTIDNPASELIKIGTQLASLQLEIQGFTGAENSGQYFNLDKALIQLSLQLKSLKVSEGSDLQVHKCKLLDLIELLSETLEKNVKDVESLQEVEKDVNEMIMKVDSFVGYVNDPDYNLLDEQLINLSVKVRKFHFNPQLEERCNKCAKNIDDCMRRLTEGAKIKGTFV